MLSRSCTSILCMASEDVFPVPATSRRLPSLMTVPGIISDLHHYGEHTEYSNLDPSSSKRRMIMVSNQLPLLAQRDCSSGEWCFSFDEDSLLFQMKDGMKSDVEVYYVGNLKVDIDVAKQERVAQQLLESFRCVPTFLPADLQKRFYHGFCKQQLWPLFHYMLPLSADHGERFDRTLWQAYISANKIFAAKVREVIDPDTDYVWIHDYHLMVLPILLRKSILQVKLGYFHHSPFPSSEIYSTLPVREEILKSLLNCDLIGFHTFDYARHFLSCCSRMLGLDYKSKRGYIGLEYVGRTISIKILPVGIHVARLRSVLNLPCTTMRAKEIQEEFRGKKLIVGVDDMDIFKGIGLKFLAVEQVLKQNSLMEAAVVLVQILNPARSTGKDVQETIEETYSSAERINKIYGRAGYKPIVLIDGVVPSYEKVAFYALADCCIVNAVRDGMNLVPYEYIVCRQGTEHMDQALGIDTASAHTSTLVVSEFVGCSPSLSGAIRVNPWDIHSVAEALKLALTGEPREMQLRHEKHFRYVSTHDIAYWAGSFELDLTRACKDHSGMQWWRTGLSFGFKAITLPQNFRKMTIELVVSAYDRTGRRAIFLDHDGTIVPQTSISKTPSREVISVLNTLCSDPKNTVFIVSGRGRDSLSGWFGPCEKLGLAAEHGCFIRWDKYSNWASSSIVGDFSWKRIVEPIMRVYTETTDGSYVEAKETAMVWHHEYADPSFGSCQAKEMLDHLEKVLANEPVVVKRGHHIVEVKPQGVSKGVVVEKLLCVMEEDGEPPDFVICIGDDRSDEDMFESISSLASRGSQSDVAKVFACTVGQKPSKAKYYLDDTSEVVKLLQCLASASGPRLERLTCTPVSFENLGW